jgi:cobalamin biosynthesis Co2+ chelatase CbiK
LVSEGTDHIMLTIFIKNTKFVQNTGMSFAVVGTTMHVLNVSDMMTPVLSHTWSAIAIVGFVMTAGSQVSKGLVTKARFSFTNKWHRNSS